MDDPFSAWRSKKLAQESVARKILGVKKSAGRADIRKAYRKLALKTHPDHNPKTPGSKSRFINITNAYSMLMDGKEGSLEPDKNPGNGANGHMTSTTGYFNWWRKRFWP